MHSEMPKGCLTGFFNSGREREAILESGMVVGTRLPEVFPFSAALDAAQGDDVLNPYL
jgi:hypothetical protein